MKKQIHLIGLISLLLIWGCTSTLETANPNSGLNPQLRLEGGYAKGGITENTDMEAIASDVPVDAFSGATNPGFYAGVHATESFRKNAIEAGIDFIHNSQTFSYNDDLNGFNGERKIGVSQLNLPVTYNLRLFSSRQKENLLSVKLGFVAQYNMLNVQDDNPTLPDYSHDKFSNGLTFGVEFFPFHFGIGDALGIRVDGYRGSQTYSDFYNQSSMEIPGTSYIKTGIIYQFNH